jgi:hypothetical protein
LGFLESLILGLGHFLLAQTLTPPAQAGAPAPTSASARDDRRTSDLALPWYVILNNPSDLNALLQKIERPDFAVVKADQLLEKVGRDAPAGSGRPSPVPAAVVESVCVEGRVAAGFADLTVRLLINLKGAEPVWVPIRLDGKRVTGAREGARELSLRIVEHKVWQVQVFGRGAHSICVELRTPLSTELARKALSLAVPEAASTSLELDYAERASGIIIGANEDFGQKDLGPGKGSRLSARLSPRSRVDVSWNANLGAGAQSPPLLTAQGDIAIEINADKMQTRSSWAIRSVRGSASTLELKIDDRDEVAELALDDQSTAGGIEGVRAAGRLTIRLAEPLRPGSTRRLTMTTRRALSSTAPTRISFTGFPFSHARVQSGAIGITQGPNLWVIATASQGLRRIDPRELPAYLRARPATSSAFEFLDQPFELELAVEASAPLVRAESKTWLSIESEVARSESIIELERVRGKLFDVQLAVAPGLEVVSVGPPEFVERWNIASESPGPAHGAQEQAARKLTIQLTALGVDRNQLALKVGGLQRIPREGSVFLGLLTLLHATSWSALYALLAERDIALELEDQAAGSVRTSDLLVPADAPPRDWPGSFPRGREGAPPLMLTSNHRLDRLPILITRHPRSLSHETSLSARVSRRGVELLQRTTLSVRFGALSSLEIRVPAAVGDRWEILDQGVVTRQELGQAPDGGRRFRLSFARPPLEKATLRFGYRISLVPGLDARTTREVALPLITFPEGTAGPTTVALALAPEVAFEMSDPTWLRASEPMEAGPNGTGPLVEFTREGTGQPASPLTFKARALEPLPLAALVAPRVLLKTVLAGDTPRTRAWYWVETHGPEFPFALPQGARWIAARIDGKISAQVETDPSQSHYCLRFPVEAGSRPSLVELEYEQNGTTGASSWEAPRLLEGGAVLQAAWEVQLPWNLAVLGVPQDWCDENRWYWDSYVWKRQPLRDTSSLGEWVLGAGAPQARIDAFELGSAEDSQRYVFSRAGHPVPLRVWVVHRSWLVAVCSGAALILGFCAIFARIRFQTVWLFLAAVGLAAAALLQPGVVFLAFQSAFIGVALTLLGLLLKLLIQHRRGSGLAMRAGEILAAPASAAPPPGVGSDDSTAIRVRVPSTMNYVPAALGAPQVEDEVQSSSLEPT